MHSSDGGATWTGVVAGGQPLVTSRLAIFHTPGQPAHLFTPDYWRSDDGGESWVKMPPPGGTSPVEMHVAFGSSPDSVFVASQKQVFRWEARSQRWSEITEAHPVSVGYDMLSSGMRRPVLLVPTYGMEIDVFRGHT